MSESVTSDPYIRRLEQLSAPEAESVLGRFESLLDADAFAGLKTCVHCGLCADSCHYYLATGEPEAIPAHKLSLVVAAVGRSRSGIGKALDTLAGKRDLDSALLQQWVDSLYGRCTGCGRCSLNCTTGIHIARLIRLGRSALADAGLVPPELQATVSTAVDTGNNMGIPESEWLETVDWLSEELQTETGDPAAKLPVDVLDADYLYTVNPREPKFFPLSLLATAKILHVAGVRWTLSRRFYDVTNYGFFSGDQAASAAIAARLRDSMTTLRARTLILGECGHGFAANRWEAPEWLGRPDSFESRSIVQLIADLLRADRIRLDPVRCTKRVTLHDPCNLVRMGGIIEDQRYVLSRAVADFVEMSPNRVENFCCGGGGGQLSMSRYARHRLKAGKIKAEQIRRTGALIVVAPCHNCIDQLSEISREYKLGVDVKTVSEIVADSLVVDR